MSNEHSDCESCKDTSCASKAGSAEETEQQRHERQLLQRRLCQIENKIMVMSGKGGVGKSSTAVNLAVALSEQGFSVGLLDVDIHGPSLPKMLGMESFRPEVSDGEGLLPGHYKGIKVMSVGFLLEKEDDAIIWRGAMKAGVIRQFVRDVEWGPLDYLLVDCPPGTGDEPLSVAQLFGGGTGAVVVTTPQDVALTDVRKSVTFCRQLKMTIHGVVENMSGFVCPHCSEIIDLFKSGGGEKLAEEMDIPFLGRVPGDPEMVSCGDRGTPCLVANPDSEVSAAIRRVAAAVAGQVAGQQEKETA